MTIEVKEIIVRTTVSEHSKAPVFDPFSYKKLKDEILGELRREQRKSEKHKKER